MVEIKNGVDTGFRLNSRVDVLYPAEWDDEDGIMVRVDGREIETYCIAEDPKEEARGFAAMLEAVIGASRGEE